MARDLNKFIQAQRLSRAKFRYETKSLIRKYESLEEESDLASILDITSYQVLEDRTGLFNKIDWKIGKHGKEQKHKDKDIEDINKDIQFTRKTAGSPGLVYTDQEEFDSTFDLTNDVSTELIASVLEEVEENEPSDAETINSSDSYETLLSDEDSDADSQQLQEQSSTATISQEFSELDSDATNTADEVDGGKAAICRPQLTSKHMVSRPSDFSDSSSFSTAAHIEGWNYKSPRGRGRTQDRNSYKQPDKSQKKPAGTQGKVSDVNRPQSVKDIFQALKADIKGEGRMNAQGLKSEYVMAAVEVARKDINVLGARPKHVRRLSTQHTPFSENVPNEIHMKGNLESLGVKNVCMSPRDGHKEDAGFPNRRKHHSSEKNHNNLPSTSFSHMNNSIHQVEKRPDPNHYSPNIKQQQTGSTGLTQVHSPRMLPMRSISCDDSGRNSPPISPNNHEHADGIATPLHLKQARQSWTHQSGNIEKSSPRVISKNNKDSGVGTSYGETSSMSESKLQPELSEKLTVSNLKHFDTVMNENSLLLDVSMNVSGKSHILDDESVDKVEKWLFGIDVPKTDKPMRLKTSICQNIDSVSLDQHCTQRPSYGLNVRSFTENCHDQSFDGLQTKGRRRHVSDERYNIDTLLSPQTNSVEPIMVHQRSHHSKYHGYEKSDSHPKPTKSPDEKKYQQSHHYIYHGQENSDNHPKPNAKSHDENKVFTGRNHETNLVHVYTDAVVSKMRYPSGQTIDSSFKSPKDRHEEHHHRQRKPSKSPRNSRQPHDGWESDIQLGPQSTHPRNLAEFRSPAIEHSNDAQFYRQKMKNVQSPHNRHEYNYIDGVEETNENMYNLVNTVNDGRIRLKVRRNLNNNTNDINQHSRSNKQVFADQVGDMIRKADVGSNWNEGPASNVVKGKRQLSGGYMEKMELDEAPDGFHDNHAVPTPSKSRKLNHGEKVVPFRNEQHCRQSGQTVHIRSEKVLNGSYTNDHQRGYEHDKHQEYDMHIRSAEKSAHIRPPEVPVYKENTGSGESPRSFNRYSKNVKSSNAYDGRPIDHFFEIKNGMGLDNSQSSVNSLRHNVNTAHSKNMNLNEGPNILSPNSRTKHAKHGNLAESPTLFKSRGISTDAYNNMSPNVDRKRVPAVRDDFSPSTSMSKLKLNTPKSMAMEIQKQRSLERGDGNNRAAETLKDPRDNKRNSVKQLMMEWGTSGEDARGDTGQAMQLEKPEENYRTLNSDKNSRTLQSDENYTTKYSNENFRTENSNENYWFIAQNSDKNFRTQHSDESYGNRNFNENYSTQHSNENYGTQNSNKNYGTQSSSENSGTVNTCENYGTLAKTENNISLIRGVSETGTRNGHMGQDRRELMYERSENRMQDFVDEKHEAYKERDRLMQAVNSSEKCRQQPSNKKESHKRNETYVTGQYRLPHTENVSNVKPIDTFRHRKESSERSAERKRDVNRINVIQPQFESQCNYGVLAQNKRQQSPGFVCLDDVSKERQSIRVQMRNLTENRPLADNFRKNARSDTDGTKENGRSMGISCNITDERPINTAYAESDEDSFGRKFESHGKHLTSPNIRKDLFAAKLDCLQPVSTGISDSFKIPINPPVLNKSAMRKNNKENENITRPPAHLAHIRKADVPNDQGRIRNSLMPSKPAVTSGYAQSTPIKPGAHFSMDISMSTIMAGEETCADADQEEVVYL
ncbi:uncharacterized protein LOC127851768 isoform X2 [Dreissena polymorpha]|uniref:uncharacterized protein LOC127851768 isoform X2 n=1 Tax=Dreissena polymorpha TaxID=45954 RepID=UPI002264740D|nr:uncharacterized protein LOC127851768 isoform X2 [Dreissena polymorpha]